MSRPRLESGPLKPGERTNPEATAPPQTIAEADVIYVNIVSVLFSLSEVSSKKSEAENLVDQLNNKLVDCESER